MNCDLVYASNDAKIAWRSNGGSGRYIHLWPWLVGVRRTKELLFTGRLLSGEEAAAMGMVNAALPPDELDGHVRNVARQLTRVPLPFLALEKQASNACLDLMGARYGTEIAGVLHAVSHLTSASHEQAEAIHSNDWRTAVQRRNARYTVDGGQA
jgi:enoyl-CoA hydratase